MGCFDDLAHAVEAPFKAVDWAVNQIPFVGPYIVPGALTLAGQPELAAAYSGIQNGIKTGNPLSGALAAAGSYAGNSLGTNYGNQIFGNTQLGNLTAGAQNVFENATGATLGSALGGSLGSNLGAKLGSNVGQMLNPMAPNAPPGAPGFQASRSPALGLPQSLSQFSSLNPQQQESNIATRGVYGQGNGPQENQYFTNLINRQLVDDSGKVAGDTSSINPVEGQYLNQIGLGGYNNPTDLLKKISQYAG